LATYIITAGLDGYGFNVKTGQVVQNGLLFVDSKPSGAEIYLNGKDQNTRSPARLILPAGKYSLKLTKAGYHDWSNRFILNEQRVARYQYPFLFPLKPRTVDLKSYNAQPPLITQSPDQKWLLIEDLSASSTVPTFDEYDTTTLDKTAPTVSTVAIPSNLLTDYSASSVLTEVEWSTDNTHVLLKHEYPGGSEYIIFDRDKPDQSINVNTYFGISPSDLALYNKSVDRLYVYNQADQTLSVADVNAKSVGTPIIKHVLAFKPYGKNLVNYITDSNEPSGKVAAKIWDNGKIYPLNEFTAGSIYMIDAAQYQGHFYYADGSDKSGRITIFKDPEDNDKNPAIGKALPTIALDLPGASKLKFSNNARFIGVESGQNFAIYDMENQEKYEYGLDGQLAADMNWMDGNRFIGSSDGNVLVMDFDGTNKHVLSSTSLTSGGFFSSNYNHLLTIASSGDNKAFLLKDIDMRAGSDLPAR
jgi:hypothetical protein